MSANKKSSIAAAVKAALMAASALGVVHAQDVREAPTQQKEPSPEEVTVYGQAIKYRPDDQTSATGLRMELIDTPQSISVISAEMIDAVGGRSAYEAVDMIPGVHQAGQGFGYEELRIRGQGVDPRINGINISAGASNLVDSYALERLEVVRGPATVLYGLTGAFGGEINQILKKPQADFQADIGFEAGDFDHRRYEADFTGSIPGTDERLKVRLLGAYSDSGTPFATVVETNNIDSIFSGALTYDLTPATSASVYVLRQDRDLDPTDGCTLLQDENDRLSIPRSIPLERFYCGDPKQNHGTVTQDFAAASLRHRFANDWQLEAKAAGTKSERLLDYVFSFGPAGAFALNDGEVYLYNYVERVEEDVVTSNLSLSGNFDLLNRTHQFFAALERQNQEFTSTNYETVGLGFLDFLEDGGKGVLADGSPIPNAPEPVLAGVQFSDVEELRGSFQMLLNPMERLEILAGLLVQRTELDITNTRASAPSTSAILEQTDWVGRFGLTYDLVNAGRGLTDAKAYYSYSEGFEPNVGIFDADGDALTDPQDMKSHEVGLKTEWLDGNVGASLALYDAELTNIPSTIFDMVGESGGTFSVVLDGERKYRGAEFELLGEILPGWNAAFSYAHTDTEIVSLLIPERLAVANVPKNQASLYTSYEFLAGPLKGLIVGASAVRKIDSPLVDNVATIFDMGYDPNDQVLDSSTRVDFRLSYSGFTGALEGLEIFGRLYNAFDERSYRSISGHPGFTNTIDPPRTITAGIRYNFGR